MSTAHTRSLLTSTAVHAAVQRFSECKRFVGHISCGWHSPPGAGPARNRGWPTGCRGDCKRAPLPCARPFRTSLLQKASRRGRSKGCVLSPCQIGCRTAVQVLPSGNLPFCLQHHSTNVASLQPLPRLSWLALGQHLTCHVPLVALSAQDEQQPHKGHQAQRKAHALQPQAK